MMFTLRNILLTLGLLLIVVACGGSAEPTPAPTAVPPTAEPTAVPPTAEPTVEPTAEPTATPEEVGPTAVNTLNEVKSATVQIEAQGTFRDPEVGTLYNAAGRGSGFIIDPSGIAVTNNHVVTGAALLRVWVGGESEPRNARILGVSECADLAVIQIEGEDFPFLEWYDGTADVGLDVYAAGFPLGDPEFTLTRGIISKARADGRTSWASVSDVLEHDATINPGNSGGPLVTSDGKVVAVNYAGASDVGQFFAIAQPQALPVIEQMRNGEDVLSIGVNGTAVNNGSDLSGIWVSSVKSGSPADQAGVKGGDIITALEGLILATDGTMGDYCDILRTHAPEDTLALEVLRFDTSEVLEGQLNGRELEQAYSFAQELAQDTGSTPTETGTAYNEYVEITDDTGTMFMSVPVQWTDIDGSAWQADGTVIGNSLTAAPDIEALLGSWDSPGVFFGVTTDYTDTVDSMLDLFDYSESCTASGREPYEDPLYTGVYDFWYDCGDANSMVLVLAAVPEDNSYVALVLIQMLTDADLEAGDTILNTFYFNPNP
jgi:serine protease Do